MSASLRSLGHTVVPLQEDEMDWTDVPRLADEVGAHMLLWTRTWPATMEVVMPELARLRDMGVPSVAFHLDLFLGLEREHQVQDQPFFHTDLLVTPHDSDRWAEFGIRHFWSPPGVFDGECGVVPPNKRRWPHEAVFVGSHPYPHPAWMPVRASVVHAFQREFGRSRFAVWPKRGHPIRGADLQELYATAKVVVGDSCLVGDPRAYWSDRVPESCGRGAFLLHPIVPGYIDRAPVHEFGFVDGEHLRAYPAGDGQAAVELARAALADPVGTAEVAAAGRALVLGRDTYRHRFERLLGHVEVEFGWRDAPGPSPVPAPAEGLRLEIGSGRYPTPGFTHLDLNPAAPGVDIVGPAFPLDLPDASVQEMRCVDVLEHLSWRDTATALREWARVIEPGGRLYVQVPDAGEVMRWFVEEPERLLDRLPPDVEQTALAGATWRLLGGHADGDQSVEGDDWRLNAHYALFDMPSLCVALVAAGFAVESAEVNIHPNLMLWCTRR